MTLGDGLPVMEQIGFEEAVRLVGKKPANYERKDLITLWGFGRKNWRWCMDVGMSLDAAIDVHRKIGEEYKTVAAKSK